MKILDLHGEYHDSVQLRVENFILLNETPLKIITGDSPRMRELVKQILERHNLEYHPEWYMNYGAYIVREKTK